MKGFDKIRSYFDKIRKSLFKINSDFAMEAIVELAVFCTLVTKADDKITQEEVDVVKQITRIPITKEQMKDIIQRTKWDMIKFNFPIMLQVSIVNDLESSISLSDPNSKANEYLINMRLLGQAISHAGGNSQKKLKISNDFVDSLVAKAKDYFDSHRPRVDPNYN